MALTLYDKNYHDVITTVLYYNYAKENIPRYMVVKY